MSVEPVSRERLQKILSQAGYGSRREMERWIAEGQVKINGVIAKLGDVANQNDTIFVKGKLMPKPLKAQDKTRVILYHKRVGEISSRDDPHHGKTVFDELPSLRRGRWIQVGRLDINTSGLLLFTNNGDLAQYLTHPKYEFEREYAVRVRGQVSDEMVRLLRQGVQLDDGVARFKKIVFRGGEGVNSWYHVVLTEGRNREVRRLWQSQGLEVSRLIRIRYGTIFMPRGLARGEWVDLPTKDVDSLLKQGGFTHE